MSGRLPFHVNQVILFNWMRDWNMPSEMTAFPAKLKQAGYATHMVGKWHTGMQDEGQTPKARGFDTSFCFFDRGEDHWTQAMCTDNFCNLPVDSKSVDPNLAVSGWEGNTMDLWCHDGPCPHKRDATLTMGRNGQLVGSMDRYSDHMYTMEAVRIISAHDPSVPKFLPHRVPQQPRAVGGT